MYVCICNAITSAQINQEIDKGACSLADLKQRLGVAGKCGSCSDEAHAIIESRASQSVRVFTHNPLTQADTARV